MHSPFPDKALCGRISGITGPSRNIGPRATDEVGESLFRRSGVVQTAAGDGVVEKDAASGSGWHFLDRKREHELPLSRIDLHDSSATVRRSTEMR
jgi:hypothetical protein